MRFLKRTREIKDTTNEKIDEILRKIDELKEHLTNTQEKVNSIENFLANRLPPDILTERKFIEEVESGDEIVEKIMSKVQGLVDISSLKNVIEEKLERKLGIKPSPVEMRRIERITNLLQKHGKLSSWELANLTGLSRTRCNEYFKKMESLGIVEPVEVGRQKFYRLS